jgi:DNA-binding protein HU-beta
MYLAIHAASCGDFTNTKGMTMNKSDLIAAVANSSELTNADAAAATDAVLDVITNALKDGETIQLTGFGSFSVSERAAREGRNPSTGETIQIAASKQAKFKPGKVLKDAVNA